MTGNKLKTTLIAAVAVLAGLTGCQDLDVDNPNAPNRQQALATPGDVASLIGGSYLNYFNYAQQFTGHGPALSTASDEHSSSWGNFGARQFGNEPRLAINNNPSWSYAYVIENPWYWSYGSISAVSDGLRSMEEGVELDEPAQARAFARFMQGISHAALAASYDQAFVFDETVDLATADLELQPYGDVMDAAMGYLQQAVDIANNNEFTLPEGWINGRELSSDEFARMVNSYMARYKASVARPNDEVSNETWTEIVGHVEAGIEEDFSVAGESWNTDWWSGFKSYGGWFPIWARTDLRLLGKADTSGAYQTWEATPPEERQPFEIYTPDRRITGHEANPNVEGEPETGPTSQGKYLTYYPTISFVPGRGTYHFSNYGDTRYGHPSTSHPIIEISRAEMDLLKAEAMIAMDNADSAAALVNKTRVPNGELPPVTASGVSESSGCVPQDEEGNCGTLMEALQYEKRIETWHVSAGVQFFDLRRWGQLEPGTPIHFPLPGAELQVLEREIYTYGGGGEGSAGGSLVGQNVDLSARIDYGLRALRDMQEKAVPGRPSMQK